MIARLPAAKNLRGNPAVGRALAKQVFFPSARSKCSARKDAPDRHRKAGRSVAGSISN